MVLRDRVEAALKKAEKAERLAQAATVRAQRAEDYAARTRKDYEARLTEAEAKVNRLNERSLLLIQECVRLARELNVPFRQLLESPRNEVNRDGSR